MALSKESKAVVTIEGESYSLLMIPASSTAVVASVKKEMLQKINLKQVAIDLNNLGMFLRVAYNGVVGYTDLQIQVRGVYYNVADLCDDTVRTINQFSQSSKTAIQYLQTAYQFFLKDNFKAGFKALFHVAKLARKLAEEAGFLEQKYDAEYKRVQEVEKSSMKQKESVEEKQKQLEEKLQDVTQKEQDLLKKETSSRDDYEQVDKTLDDYLKQKMDIEREHYHWKREQPSLGFLKTLSNKICQVLTKNEAYATPKAPTAGISESIDHYNKKKEEIFKSIAEQEQQRQELLTQMASFTDELQQCVGTDGSLGKSAVQSLQYAIKALGNLARTMAVAKRYWEGMGDLCRNVSESHEFVESLIGDDKIAKMLEDDTFKENAVKYFGSWVALNDICEEYKGKIEQVQNNVDLQIRECPSPEEARSAVLDLAEKFKKELAIQQKKPS